MSNQTEVGPTVMPPARRAGGGRRRLGAALGVSLAAALLVAAAVVVVEKPGAGAGVALLRPSGIPAELPTSVADVMALSPVPGVTAPAFDLVDQQGRSVTLSSLRGDVVVLEAMDPHCTDICPIVSREFLDAYRQLGAERSKVVFAALNVNQYFATVADMETFSLHNGLTGMPTWHFLTGPVAALQAAWKAYDIEVQAPDPTADIIHTSVVWWIDPGGRERYVATPMVDHTPGGASYLPLDVQGTWATGIAITARSLLR